MSLEVLLTCLLIIVARIADVSLGTMRTMFIVSRQRGWAFLLGFGEVLIWIVVVSRIISTLSDPLYLVSYALGFALGNWIGITVEGRLAMGRQIIRIFTREGDRLVGALRSGGFAVTQFEGKGEKGPISLLITEAERKHAFRVIGTTLEVDPEAFYLVDDVRWSAPRRVRFHFWTGWRAIGKRK